MLVWQIPVARISTRASCGWRGKSRMNFEISKGALGTLRTRAIISAITKVKTVNAQRNNRAQIVHLTNQ